MRVICSVHDLSVIRTLNHPGGSGWAHTWNRCETASQLCCELGVLVSARLLQLSHESVDSDEDKYQYSYRGNNIELDCEWIEYSVL